MDPAAWKASFVRTPFLAVPCLALVLLAKSVPTRAFTIGRQANIRAGFSQRYSNKQGAMHDLSTASEDAMPLSKPTFDVTGKNFVVTGASQGLGLGIAETLMDRGAAGILITARNEDKLKEACQKLRERNSKCQVHYFHMDSADVQSCIDTIDEAEKKFTKIHGLVNAAGISKRVTLAETTGEVWDQIMHINVRGPTILTKHVAEVMKKTKTRGSIVNISSINAHGGDPPKSVYAVSKAALNCATKVHAYELKEHRIRVNSINVGWMLTEGEWETQKQEMEDEQWLEKHDPQHPMGRLLRPVDIASTVGFLLSDASLMVTGAHIDEHPEIVMGTV